MAIAQDFDLGEIVVVQAGYEAVEEYSTGVSVSVIDEDDLEETGETRVVDFLARLPGLSVRTEGPMGTRAALTLRGISQNNIAVRIDGIDVSDPAAPQVAFDFGGLMTTDISRIEVLRGSQSALYGSEAIGGVINITSKRATRDGFQASGGLEYGSYDTLRSSLTLANRGEGHETAVTLSHARSDGFSAAEENAGNVEADGFEATRISLFGRYALGEATLELSGFVSELRFDFDEAGPVDGTPDDVTQRDQQGLRAALQFASGTVDHELALSYFNSDRTMTGTNIFGPYFFNYDGTRTGIEYQGATDLGSGARLVFGAGHEEETYSDDLGLFGSQRHTTSVDTVFAEVNWAANADMDLSFALRHDEHSQFGGFTTGRLSGVWRLANDVTLRANLANGYRAPSNYELYDAFSGNAGLTPETSRSFDIGVEKTYGDAGYVKATAFFVEAEDIIDYSFTTFGYVQAAGTSTRRGVELAGGFALRENLRIDGNYTFTDSGGSAVLDSSSWSLSAPRHSLSATLTADLGERVSMSLTGLMAKDLLGGLPDYGVAHATVTYDITDAAQAYLRVENIFDKEYQTVPGFGTSDRAWYFGLRANF